MYTLLLLIVCGLIVPQSIADARSNAKDVFKVVIDKSHDAIAKELDTIILLNRWNTNDFEKTVKNTFNKLAGDVEYLFKTELSQLKKQFFAKIKKYCSKDALNKIETELNEMKASIDKFKKSSLQQLLKMKPLMEQLAAKAKHMSKAVKQIVVDVLKKYPGLESQAKRLALFTRKMKKLGEKFSKAEIDAGRKLLKMIAPIKAKSENIVHKIVELVDNIFREDLKIFRSVEIVVKRCQLQTKKSNLLVRKKAKKDKKDVTTTEAEDIETDELDNETTEMNSDLIADTTIDSGMDTTPATTMTNLNNNMASNLSEPENNVADLSDNMTQPKKIDPSVDKIDPTTEEDKDMVQKSNITDSKPNVDAENIERNGAVAHKKPNTEPNVVTTDKKLDMEGDIKEPHVGVPDLRTNQTNESLSDMEAIDPTRSDD